MNSLTPGAYQHAVMTVNQLHAQDDIAQDADARAKRQMNDDAIVEYQKEFSRQGYVTPDMITKMDQDQRLTEPGARVALRTFAAQDFGYENIGKFGSVADIVKLGIPGPQGQAVLTPNGVQRASAMLMESRKDPDQAAVNQTKASLINYAKSKLSFEDDTGPVKIRDPKGEAIFNAKFVPQFEAAYDAWTKAGKNPWEMLTQENVDKMMGGLRPKAQMAADKIAAEGGGQVLANAPLPEPPQNVNTDSWHTLLQAPPLMATGQVATPQQYGMALSVLLENPNDQTKEKFNKWFGVKGAMADDVLAKMSGPQAPKPAAPAIASPPAAPAVAPAQQRAADHAESDRLMDVARERDEAVRARSQRERESLVQ
jgi:hypothetical protein